MRVDTPEWWKAKSIRDYVEFGQAAKVGEESTQGFVAKTQPAWPDGGKPSVRRSSVERGLFESSIARPCVAKTIRHALLDDERTVELVIAIFSAIDNLADSDDLLSLWKRLVVVETHD